MIREILTWIDYQLLKRVISRIDDAKYTNVENGFRCPHCHLVVMHPLTIEHGHSYTHSCGLKMTVTGNAVHCELPEKNNAT